MKLTWDDDGKRFYETGTDHAVLYLRDDSGQYTKGYAWNGITAVTDSPSGAEVTPIYADNIKYLNLISAEEYGLTIEAYTYPPEFAVCDGSLSIARGVTIGQQNRETFGFSYRTIVGNDIKKNEYGYKIHLVYGCLAAPSERSYATVNDSPEAITMSWEVSTTPESTNGKYKPTSVIVIDSTTANPSQLASFENILYGDAENNPRLPHVSEVLCHFDA